MFCPLERHPRGTLVAFFPNMSSPVCRMSVKAHILLILQCGPEQKGTFLRNRTENIFFHTSRCNVNPLRISLSFTGVNNVAVIFRLMSLSRVFLCLNTANPILILHFYYDVQQHMMKSPDYS